MNSTPSSSTAAPAAQNSAQQKPKIDPLQLLKCLSILLNTKGGIRGRGEVQRVKGLMTKYSKKLVSKCIYLNILQATELPLLDLFYEEGGWELLGSWLQIAVTSRNWPLATQVLTLMESSPVTLIRLKRNTTPRMVKELSMDSTAPGVQAVARRLVQKWKDMLRSGDGVVAAAGMGLYANSTLSTPSSHPNLTIVQNSNTTANVQQRILTSHGFVNANIVGTTQAAIVSTNTNLVGAPRGLTYTTANISATGVITTTQKGRVTAKLPTTTLTNTQQAAATSHPQPLVNATQDPPSATQSTDEGSGGGVSGGGDNSSSQHSQDESSNGSTESDPGVPSVPATPTTPIRITIRSGSQVLAKVSSQRLSQDSTDSDDNKPLSVLREEVRHKDDEPGATTTTTSTTQPRLPPPQPVPQIATSTTTHTPQTQTATTTSSIATTLVSSQPTTTISTTTTSVPHTLLTFTTGQPTTPTTSHNGLSIPSETSDKISEKKTDVKDVNEKVNGESVQTKEEAVKKDVTKDKDKVNTKKDKDKKTDHKDKVKVKDKEKEKEKDKKSRDSEKKDKERSKSSREKDKDRKDKDKHRDSKHRHSSGSSRDKDKDKKDRDHHKGRSSSNSSSSSSSHKDKKSSSKDKDHDREKDKKDRKDRDSQSQEKEDIATLEKIKPLSTDGLSKIPRKSDKTAAPPTFLDALGSADMDVQTPKKATVKTYKSRGFRNTGLLDEPTLPPKKGDKKNAGPGAGVKRASALEDTMSTPPEKKVKSSVSSQPSSGDKPGGVKLISPKRPSLSDDGGFMAAITAAGTPRKKVSSRKRKSSESDSGRSSEEGPKNGEEGAVKLADEGTQDPALSSPTGKTGADEKPTSILSPTNIRPTFNFYQETLKDEEPSDEKSEEEKTEGEETEKKEEEEEEEKGEKKEEGEGKDGEDVEMKEEDNMDIDESEKESLENGDGGGGGGGGYVCDEDIPRAPAVPAPAHEDYERVEVTFYAPPHLSSKPTIVYHRSPHKPKKSVKWRAEEDLHQVFIFELDETERVNVNTIKFNELMVMEKQREREAMGGRRMGGMMGGGFGEMEEQRQNGEEYMRWRLLPVMQTGQPVVMSGYKSQERVIQASRQSSTMPSFFHPLMLPDTPREPEPELTSRTEPKEIPLHDVLGQDNLHDHRDKFWPEPLMEEPAPINYGYRGGGVAMGGMPQGGNMGGPPSGGGSHWVMGGPPAPPYGGPMYGGPGGPGPSGPPPQGGHGGYGGGPGPGNYPQDMSGMDGGPGWGGPGPDYPGPMMGGGGGGGGMMMGHPNMPPPNMMNNMEMNRGGGGHRYRGNRGGSWKHRSTCRFWMSSGHCRHGDSCNYLHSKPR